MDFRKPGAHVRAEFKDCFPGEKHAGLHLQFFPEFIINILKM